MNVRVDRRGEGDNRPMIQAISQALWREEKGKLCEQLPIDTPTNEPEIPAPVPLLELEFDEL